MNKKPFIISLIAALAKDRAIGRENGLPWYIPEDFNHFKQKTLGKPIIMGRKTFISIGRPLPKRLNIVITRQKDYKPDDVVTAPSLEAALETAKKLSQSDEIMIIGGASVYEQALPLADKLYLTHIDVDVSDADAFFPDYKTSGKWHRLNKTLATAKTDDLPDYYFETLIRTK